MKKIKILVVLTLALGVITVSSCKKKDPTPSYSITADVNGTATAFNTGAVGAKGTVEGETFTTISGKASNGDVLSITLAGTVTAGTTYTSGSGDSETQPLVVYAPAGSDSDFLNNDDSANKITVTVSSVSNGTIQGTFKGDLVAADFGSGNNTPATKTLANGKFSVKIN